MLQKCTQSFKTWPNHSNVRKIAYGVESAKVKATINHVESTINQVQSTKNAQIANISKPSSSYPKRNTSINRIHMPMLASKARLNKSKGRAVDPIALWCGRTLGMLVNKSCHRRATTATLNTVH